VEPPEIFQPEVVRLCSRAGVAITFIPELPKIRVSGVTRWLSSHKALIQLNLRYKTDDQLWFTFFHEAGHIIQRRKRAVFIDHEFNQPEDVEEQEANNFAANILIPPTKLKEFTGKGDKTKKAIKFVASEIGIAPGIVVGRLQHEGFLPYSYCNDLKRRFCWDRS